MGTTTSKDIPKNVFFSLNSVKNTYVSYDMVKKTDIIYVISNSYENFIVFSYFEKNIKIDLCKIEFDSKENANNSLDNLLQQYNNYNKNILLND